MGKFIKRLCPECGGSLSTQRRNRGHSCRTNGCPIQKVFFDKSGKIVRIVFSSEPKEAPIDLEEVRIMAELNV